VILKSRKVVKLVLSASGSSPEWATSVPEGSGSAVLAAQTTTQLTHGGMLAKEPSAEVPGSHSVATVTRHAAEHVNLNSTVFRINY
jgi:hypothetical protein